MPQNTQQIEAVDVGHANVRQHEIDPFEIIEQIDGLARRVGRDRRVPS